MNYLSKEEVLKKDVIVDSEGYWHFPSGSELLEKGKRLTKESNYVIYDYNNEKEINLSELENRIRWAKNAPGCWMRGYSELREYIDRKNKIYYVYFGKSNSYDMWC